MTTPIHRFGLLLILAAYLLIGTLFATRTPLWQAPDEPAHYNVIRQIAQNGCCPVMESGDWDQGYLDAIKAAGFTDQSIAGRLETIQYEDQQPPLYYLLASIPYRVTNGNPIALRLFSLLLGAGTVTLAYAIARICFTAFPSYALLTAGIVAFIPQHIAMMSSINNDSLAELVAALTLFATCCYLGLGSGWIARELRRPIALGLLLGIAFVTKLTIYPLSAVLFVAILWKHRGLLPRAFWLNVIRDGAIVFGVGMPIGSAFWIRNAATYGGFDILAQAAHDRVVVGQPQTTDLIAKSGAGFWVSDFAATVFRSFWGQFGWMGVPMTDRIYLVLFGLTGLAAVGILIYVVNDGVRGGRWFDPQAVTIGGWTYPQRGLILIFGLLILLTFGTLIYWNLKYVQFQGRYLFPALIPIALLFAGGFGAWFALLRRHSWALILIVGLAAFDLYVLFRIILPAFNA